MPFKPVGIDENGNLPPRAKAALSQIFVTKPTAIQNGQVPIWDAASATWIGGLSGGGGMVFPPSIDGGVWDETTNDWSVVGTWPTPPSSGLDLDGGTPTST